MVRQQHTASSNSSVVLSRRSATRKLAELNSVSVVLSGSPVFNQLHALSEPIGVHNLQELRRDRVSGCGADDRINGTMRTHRRLLVINPFRNLGRREYAQAIETPADNAGFQLSTIPDRMLMRGHVSVTRSSHHQLSVSLSRCRFDERLTKLERTGGFLRLIPNGRQPVHWTG